MREYLFKGKRKDNEEWVYGNLVHITETYKGEEDIQECNIYQIITYDGIGFDVIPETVGQYTGLKDKNEVKIYDGDIIQYENIHKGVVKYSEKYAQFILKETDNLLDECEALGEFNVKVFEVIGNIHDNPELLEKEQKCLVEKNMKENIKKN